MNFSNNQDHLFFYCLIYCNVRLPTCVLTFTRLCCTKKQWQISVGYNNKGLFIAHIIGSLVICYGSTPQFFCLSGFRMKKHPVFMTYCSLGREKRASGNTE